MAKILLLYDTPGWACESECRATAKHLELNAPGYFDIDIAQCGQAPAGSLSAYDLLLSTIYYHLLEAAHPKSISMISSYSYWIRKGWKDGWPHLKEWKYMVAHNAHIKSLLTAEDHPCTTLLYHTFDHDVWTPSVEARGEHATFKVGYAGHKNQALKGVSLLEEAVAATPNCVLETPTWEEGRIPHAEMPAFYRSLDVYVCMSKPGDEAGPRSPVEAGLCGIPVITTKAGQIGEMIVDGENGLVIDRTVEALSAALIRMKEDRDLRSRLAAAIRPSLLPKWVLQVGQEWTDYLILIAESAA